MLPLVHLVDGRIHKLDMVDGDRGLGLVVGTTPKEEKFSVTNTTMPPASWEKALSPSSPPMDRKRGSHESQEPRAEKTDRM